MKIQAKIYAQSLLETKPEANLKKISQNFWKLLQKNKQYSDLEKILEALDQESAKAEQKILAKIYSKNLLDAQELAEVQKKLEKKFEKQIIIKNIINKNLTGIIVKTEDQIIDLTVENKIIRLKKVINGD